MLREIINIKQIEGEDRRRWFCDDYFDLILWENNERITAFQLTYDIPGRERTLTWQEKTGASHHLMDCGEDQPSRPKASPILMAEGPCCQLDDLATRFIEAGREMDKHIVYFIEEKITTCQLNRVTEWQSGSEELGVRSKELEVRSKE